MVGMCPSIQTLDGLLDQLLQMTLVGWFHFDVCHKIFYSQHTID